MSRAEEYRLRAFEAAYVEPHVRFLENVVPHWSWTDIHVIEAASSEASLRTFLLLEASEWIELGTEAGYFATYLKPLFALPAPSSIWSWYRSTHATLVPSSPIDPPKPRHWWYYYDQLYQRSYFDDALTTAVSDLTPDRLEFLRLYLFADDSEWLAKIRQLDDFRHLLYSNAGPFPDDLVDTVSWALKGPDITMRSAGVPSDWRASTVLAVPRMVDRARLLESIRADIAASVQLFVNREIEREGRPRGRRDGGWFPEELPREGDDEV